MENPIPSDDSIQERLEKLLSADEPQAEAPEVTDEAKPETVKAEPQAETEVEQEPEGEGAGDEQSLTLSDLSKYLSIDESALDVDDDGALMVKTKVDGVEGKAKLSDLITSYQLRSHLDNEMRNVAEQRKAIQAQSAEIEQAIQARVQQLDDLANLAQNDLLRQFQGIDWGTLRVTDPAEYAALSRDFEARQAQISQVLQQTQAQRQQYEAQRQHSTAESLQNEARALPQLIPEWNDGTVAQKERAEIREWALNFGLPQNEVDSVGKAAYVAILRKAMLYDRMQGSKAAVEKKVANAPKLVKPGQSQPRNSQENSLKSIKQNIRKSGGKDGIVEYLLASGKV